MEDKGLNLVQLKSTGGKMGCLHTHLCMTD